MSPNLSSYFGYAGRWLLGGLVWLAGTAQAQPRTDQPIGRFLTDSVEIGRPFQYSLSWRHRQDQNVLFPDTARHFRPFNVIQLTLFPTRTSSAGSLDSAVYTLLSFEAAPVQTLQLPVRLISPTDTMTLQTIADTVRLQSRLPKTNSPIRSLSLTPETTLMPVRRQFNYPILLTVLLILATVAGAIYILFGTELRQRYREFLLYERHQRFVRTYQKLIQQLDVDQAADTANAAVIGWKLYLEQLEREPFLALTTSEIAERLHDQRLTDALRETDAVIYSGTFSEQLPTALHLLRDTATKAYRRRLVGLRRGNTQ